MAPESQPFPTQRVVATPSAETANLRRDLAIADRLAESLDSKFSVAGIRFGWDSIVGLVPGVGDLATTLLGLYPVYLAGRHDLGGWTILRMLGNIGLDFLVGLVPLLGDVFDVAFKSNRRNLELFKAAAARRHGI